MHNLDGETPETMETNDSTEDPESEDSANGESDGEENDIDDTVSVKYLGVVMTTVTRIRFRQKYWKN